MRFLSLLFFLFSIFFFSQSKKELENYLLNFQQDFVGRINNQAQVLVSIKTVEHILGTEDEVMVTGLSDVEGAIHAFSGRLALESKRDSNPMATLFFKFDFKEEKGDLHTGILSGSLAMKGLTPALALVVFEGTWESYDKKLRYPIFFDNSELIKTKLIELTQ